MKYKFKKIDSKRSIVEDLEGKEDLRIIAEYEKGLANGDITIRPIEELWKEIDV